MEPETGIRYTDASVDITRDQVDHYFGEFHCSCVAITKKVAKVSNSALVTTACKYYFWHLFFIHRNNFRCIYYYILVSKINIINILLEGIESKCSTSIANIKFLHNFYLDKPSQLYT